MKHEDYIKSYEQLKGELDELSIQLKTVSEARGVFEEAMQRDNLHTICSISRTLSNPNNDWNPNIKIIHYKSFYYSEYREVNIKTGIWSDWNDCELIVFYKESPCDAFDFDRFHVILQSNYFRPKANGVPDDENEDKIYDLSRVYVYSKAVKDLGERYAKAKLEEDKEKGVVKDKKEYQPVYSGWCILTGLAGGGKHDPWCLEPIEVTAGHIVKSPQTAISYMARVLIDCTEICKSDDKFDKQNEEVIALLSQGKMPEKLVDLKFRKGFEMEDACNKLSPKQAFDYYTEKVGRIKTAYDKKKAELGNVEKIAKMTAEEYSAYEQEQKEKEEKKKAEEAKRKEQEALAEKEIKKVNRVGTIIIVTKWVVALVLIKIHFIAAILFWVGVHFLYKMVIKKKLDAKVSAIREKYGIKQK